MARGVVGLYGEHPNSIAATVIAGDPEKRKAWAAWWKEVLADGNAIERWARKECRETKAPPQEF